MNKPRLTKSVLNGLISLATIVEASCAADLTGYDEDQMNAAQLKRLKNIHLSAQWIREMQAYKTAQTQKQKRTRRDERQPRSPIIRPPQ